MSFRYRAEDLFDVFACCFKATLAKSSITARRNRVKTAELVRRNRTVINAIARKVSSVRRASKT